jgi:hypothetical protein
MEKMSECVVVLVVAAAAVAPEDAESPHHWSVKWGRYHPPSVLNDTVPIQRTCGALPSFFLRAFTPRCGQRDSFNPLLITLFLRRGDYVHLFRLSDNTKYNMGDFILFKQAVPTIEATQV